MARRDVFRPPVGFSEGEIASVLEQWADTLNNFVVPLTDQPQASADGGASIDVSGGRLYELTNGAPQSVTDLTGGREGQNIVLKLDANTTLVHDVTKIYLKDQANLVGGDCVVVSLYLRSDGVWQEEGV